jgi:hypothetical protein
MMMCVQEQHCFAPLMFERTDAARRIEPALGTAVKNR